MILESAFNYLPEIFTAARHPEVDYEGTLVGAFAMAVLQELNARNCPNPIGAIRQEVPYRKTGFPVKDEEPRSLRADLFVNLQPLRLGTLAFSDQGHRFFNWVEAKYFRELRPGGNGTGNIASLCADIIRLVTLTPFTSPWCTENPQKVPREDCSGRYMLHVYSGDPTAHLGLKQMKEHRNWAVGLITPGRSEFTLSSESLNNEKLTFSKYVATAGLKFELTMGVTNMIITNRVCTKAEEVNKRPKDNRLWHSGFGASKNNEQGPTFILSRVNEFRVTLSEVDGHLFNFTQSVQCDRHVEVTKGAGLDEFRNAFGSRIGKKALKTSEQTKPVHGESDDLAPEGGDAEEAANGGEQPGDDMGGQE